MRHEKPEGRRAWNRSMRWDVSRFDERTAPSPHLGPLLNTACIRPIRTEGAVLPALERPRDLPKEPPIVFRRLGQSFWQCAATDWCHLGPAPRLDRQFLVRAGRLSGGALLRSSPAMTTALRRLGSARLATLRHAQPGLSADVRIEPENLCGRCPRSVHTGREIRSRDHPGGGESRCALALRHRGPTSRRAPRTAWEIRDAR